MSEVRLEWKTQAGDDLGRVGFQQPLIVMLYHTDFVFVATQYEIIL